MIDHAARYTDIVKGEIGQRALADKLRFGFGVNQAFGPYNNPQTGEVEVGPCWLVMVSMKSNMAPFEMVPLQVAVPGLLPPDELFRRVAEGLVEQLRETVAEQGRIARA